MRTYLSGGMEYADGEGRNWRQSLQEWLEQSLGHSAFNPNIESETFFARNYPGIDFRRLKSSDPELYRSIAQRLVEIDCEEIARRSDYVICYWDEGAMKGAGTKGELTMAKFFGKPVYLVTSIPTEDIPGWVIGCTSRFFPGFGQLKDFLVAQNRVSGEARQI